PAAAAHVPPSPTRRSSDLATLDERLAEAGERKTAATLGRRAAEERLEAVLAERGGAEEELADAAGTREQAMQVLYRLRSVVERLDRKSTRLNSSHGATSYA